MRLVLVEWWDSYGSSSEWAPLALADQAAPLKCRSVGWLVKDGPDMKVIVPHLSAVDDHPSVEPHGCGDMAIPTCAIFRLVDLHVPDGPHE